MLFQRVLCSILLCVSPVRAQSVFSERSDPGQTGPVKPASDTVVLDIFSVVSTQDTSYRAANSITATKLAAEVRNIPLTIDIFTSDFMKDVGAVEVSDVLRYANGINAFRSGFQDDFTYTIRGFTSAANVQLRNGIRKSGLLDAAGLERVEVVKGPAGVINGQQSPGGLVNSITKQPLDKFAATFDQSFGSFDFSRSVIDVTGPAYTDDKGRSVAYRVVVAETFNGDFRELATMKKQYLYPIVVLKNGSTGTQFTIDTEFSQSRGDPARSLDWVYDPSQGMRVPAPVPYKFNQNTHETFYFFRSSNTVLDFKQKIGEHLILRADYQYQRRTRDLFTYQGFVSSNLQTISRNVNRIIQQNFNQNYYVSALTKYNVGPVEGQTLVEYDHLRGPFTFHSFQSTQPIETPWLVNDPSTWNRNTNVLPTFAQQTWQQDNFPSQSAMILNQFNYKNRIYLSASARWDELTQSVLTLQGTPLGYQQLAYNRHVSPMAGLLYRFTKNTAIYGTYAESFVANLNIVRKSDGNFGALDPTQGKGLEMGIKTDFFEGKLSANVAVFRDEQTNVPRTVSLPDPQAPGQNFNATIQTGVERATGVELNVNAVISDSVQLVGGYSYVDAHIVSNQQNRALEGLREINAPRNKFNVFGKYSLPKLPFGSAYATIGYTYYSNMQGSADTIKTIIPGVSLIAAGVGVRTKIYGREVGVRFNVDNLLDKKYWSVATGGSIPGRPVSYAGTVSLKW